MPNKFPRCQVLPLAEQQVAIVIDGVERTRWHFGGGYPRPYFFPLIGPSGTSLTRMGHPGAPDHDHHQSIWYAHNKVLGIDFWGNRGEARIRQKQWIAYQDGDDEALLGFLLGWYDGHDPKELLEQQLLVAARPGPDGETFLEFQSTFRPQAESLEFGQTNFGFLAVRVAKNISEHFGGGRLTSSTGKIGEPAIFGQPATWMDYSGPVPAGGTEGITYFEHPSNPGQPTRWHVREDGWMTASVCMSAAVQTTRTQPLVLRHLLHAHRGPIDKARAEEISREFAARPALEAVKATVKHNHFTIRRVG